MYPVLLQGQGVTIERPRRLLGTAIAALPAIIAVALGAALIFKAASWPVSATLFAAVVGVLILFALATVFTFWAAACFTMQYMLGSRGLTIVWGTLRQFIPMERIEGLSAGRAEDRPSVGRGLSWPGLHVGRGESAGRQVLFYSTHRSPEEIVYIRTPAATYALSPHDPPRFIMEVQRFKQVAPPKAGSEAARRDIIGRHPIWADRTAQWLALGAIAVNLALWGYIFAIYPDLSPQITIQFPPLGEITEVHSRSMILVIPAVALGVLIVNVVAALGFQWKERAASYLLLTGSLFLQLLFWVSAGVAVVNA